MTNFIRRSLVVLTMLLMVPLIASAQEKNTPKQKTTYKQDEVLTEAENFFGKGAKGIADVIQKAFKEQGEPNAFIEGEEAGGAVAVGVRYGKGTLKHAGGGSRQVYWQGPSIGFDLGGNAAKTFILVYNLKDEQSLFQRFPGVDGSLYFVGGVGLNYARINGITVAPVRLGVGWRQGASVGYIHFTPEKSLNPF